MLFQCALLVSSPVVACESPYPLPVPPRGAEEVQPSGVGPQQGAVGAGEQEKRVSGAAVRHCVTHHGHRNQGAEGECIPSRIT